MILIPRVFFFSHALMAAVLVISPASFGICDGKSRKESVEYSCPSSLTPPVWKFHSHVPKNVEKQSQRSLHTSHVRGKTLSHLTCQHVEKPLTISLQSAWSISVAVFKCRHLVSVYWTKCWVFGQHHVLAMYTNLNNTKFIKSTRNKGIVDK